MHFEILVEDRSGKAALDILVPRIIGVDDTFKVHPYKGIGRLPKNLKGSSDPGKRILLDQLPRLISGYGATFAGYPEEVLCALIVVCDLDDRCLKNFRKELLDVLNKCRPKPFTRFCIAVEEGESWFLGDTAAVLSAYPKARTSVLNSYVNDSIVGTWETLADAVVVGGAQVLASKGWQAVGEEKSNWANKIAPHMKVDCNSSPSFNYFKDKLRSAETDVLYDF
jgi:hypothetical protein